MVDKIFIDTSVIVNSFLIEEKGSENSRRLLEKIKEGEMIGITSELTLVELASAITRRTNKPELSKNFVRQIIIFPNLTILPITHLTISKALEISTKYGLRACDSLQVASSLLENVTNFVQKDKDFERASKVINLLDPEDLVSK